MGFGLIGLANSAAAGNLVGEEEKSRRRLGAVLEYDAQVRTGWCR